MRMVPALLVVALAAGCGKAPAAPSASAPAAGQAAAPGTPSSGEAPAGPSMRQSLQSGAAQAEQPVAGYIFNVPVPAGNYYFAKRVAYMFPHPWEEGLTPEQREQAIWEALILHYESFRRGVSLTDEELESKINGVLQSQKQAFTRAGDPAAYAAWIKSATGEDVALFENQMRYLFQVEKLKNQIRESLTVPVTDEELQQEFLNEQNHVGGEMVTFDKKEDAETFYEQVKTPAAWDAMKKQGDRQVRPVSLMTLEAYMDLWSVPKDQMYAFHAMAIGAVGPPMPFGKQWCVYRLLEKRTGDLKDFPPKRDSYAKQVTARKRYEALKKWIEELQASAHLKIVPLEEPAAAPAPSSSTTTAPSP